jgi:hypothetical protein
MMMGLPGGACRIHGDVEMGECAGGKLGIKMDPRNSAGYIFAAKKSMPLLAFALLGFQ